MKKEDKEENMQIMFKKYMEYILICTLHFSNMIHILIPVIFFGYMCKETG